MDIEKAMQQAKASVEIEGFEIKEEHDSLVRSVLVGEINDEEFEERFLSLVGKK